MTRFAGFISATYGIHLHVCYFTPIISTDSSDTASEREEPVEPSGPQETQAISERDPPCSSQDGNNTYIYNR